ncbi:MAG TPA: family 16 glycosylhydrolase [Nocardioides sp.]|nr:family 16 glycosylhydrolase [Nocardioides sp.]
MSFPRVLTRFPARRTAATLAAGAMALTVGAVTAGSGHAVPGPIHAGNTFGWYRNHLIRYEFVNGNGPYWRTSGPGQVANQHGMLTLNTAAHGSLSATLTRQGHAYGRWEIRLRSRRYATAHTNYRVVTELVPSGGRKQHCGGDEIGLENYRLGSNRAKFYIHTLPDNDFRAWKGRNLGTDRWHTFAVEATRTHISWFVDAHVIRTERRPAALEGTPLTVRFTMRAAKGKQMNPSRMQMDWLRYWGDKYPSSRSVAAPRTVRSTYHGAC